MSCTGGEQQTTYLQDFRSEPCQVCGENASGWHCGSITCEACKKFFLRSVNGEHLKYKCIRERTCLITRTTRTQCQYCRYAKCIAIGMKLTEQNPNPKIEEIFKGIPCAVCQAASSGIHFGATTCEGCKGFFRRMIKERSADDYKCPEDNNCEVNVMTRNICRACRYRKCLQAGMSIQGSRIGRQSNLFKHKMVEMQRQGLIRTKLIHLFNSKKRNTTMNKKPLEKLFETHVYQQIIQIETAYVNHLKNLPICSLENDSVWMSCMNQLNEYQYRVRNFLEQISNFNNLTFDEKTSLVQLSTPSIILMCLCLQSEQTTNNWNYLNTSTHSSYFQTRFPFFFELNRLTMPFENQLKLIQLDSKEIGLILCLLLITFDHGQLKSTEQIEEDLFMILCEYMSAKRGVSNNDFFYLTIEIPFLHRLNKRICSYITELQIC